MSRVRRCPACEADNAADAAECVSCGNLLAGVEPIDLHAEASPAAPPVSQTTAIAEPPTATSSARRDQPGAYRLRWPWGEIVNLTEPLFVGRVPPAPEALAQRLEIDYPNVSRIHAEIYASAEGVFVRDLGSLNGTFVDGERIAPYVPHRLHVHATLRFASQLQATIIATEEGTSHERS